MKTETRAKIQVALQWLYLITDPKKNGHSDAIESCQSAKDALAAEPDEPTVSKDAKEIAVYAFSFHINKQNANFLISLIAGQIEAYAASKRPAVSKSVEELVETLADETFDAWTFNNEQKQYMGAFYKDNAIAIIQQFLDAQIAERDNRLNEQEDELDRIKSCSEGILLRMEGKYLDGISKIQIKSFIENRAPHD